ncbi:N-terminal kinase-like protein [Cyberlindnera fabianii]|uniref:N-terminal kinase-like protein n=1 Tax=Cyberlindnera fabianii TaxID=36022 RepID=A0A1V2LDP1_CYBFA|nr:N-terminal kinase-like protein [Cyberlindnera fabianii]
MNFLSKTLSSFTGSSIPYTLGDEHLTDASLPQSVWRMFDGVKKDDSTPCTVFQRDRDGSELDALALNSLRKIRSLRLPGVLKVLDTFETDSTLHIITERAMPLIDVIRTVETTDSMLQLIVFSVTKAVKFVNVEGSSVLGHLNLGSVFITQGGEIKLGGFEVCTHLQSDPNQPLYRSSRALPGFADNVPPEVETSGVDVYRGNSAYKLDSWRLGAFIYSLFNDCTLNFSKDEMIKGKGIPKNMIPAYKKITSTSITARATVEQFLKNGQNTYLNNEIIDIYQELEEFGLKTEDEKIRLFESLESVKDDAPPGFLEYRIVPELVSFFTQSPQQGAFALKLILSYGENLNKEAFSKLIKPIIIKAFTLPDRQIRMLLLGFLPKYIDHLDKSDVSDRIFTQYTTGFSDSNAAIREESVKAVLYMAPKLSERQLNNDLLRFLAKTQADEKQEIRCNTTICIGKIAETLNKSSRPTVLATAFSKALKDPFIHSRLAALMALTSSIEYFTPEIISNKILTVIAPSLLDKSSKVRDEAQKAFDLFFQKIKQEAAKLPIDQDTADDTVDEVSANMQNFGISFTNTFSKITSNLGGSLNPQASLSPSPQDSRAGTPQVVDSFKREIPPAGMKTTTVKPKIDHSSWADEIENDDDDDVDGWGQDDDEIEADDGWGFGATEAKSVAKPKTVPVSKSMAPKVTRLATETKPKLGKTTTSSGAAKKGLQLKAKSKLNIKMEVDDDEDGWGDGW